MKNTMIVLFNEDCDFAKMYADSIKDVKFIMPTLDKVKEGIIEYLGATESDKKYITLLSMDEFCSQINEEEINLNDWFISFIQVKF